MFNIFQFPDLLQNPTDKIFPRLRYYQYTALRQVKLGKTLKNHVHFMNILTNPIHDL